MITTIFFLAFVAGGNSSIEGFIAIGLAAVWAVVSIIYVFINNARNNRKMLHPEDYKEQIASSSSSEITSGV
jgi:hypothetical protein